MTYNLVGPSLTTRESYNFEWREAGVVHRVPKLGFHNTPESIEMLDALWRLSAGLNDGPRRYVYSIPWNRWPWIQ